MEWSADLVSHGGGALRRDREITMCGQTCNDQRPVVAQAPTPIAVASPPDGKKRQACKERLRALQAEQQSRQL
jgi:hypothetical protein